jgi:hypothetical protein
MNAAIKKAGEIVRKLWRCATVGVAAAALAAGLVVAAMPTGATTQPTIQITQAQAQAQRHMVTASCTGDRHYLGGYVTFTYCNNQYYRVACSRGTTGDIFGPLYAANDCDFQLYLYLTRPPTGHPALCVNPRTSTGVLKRDYQSFFITGLTGNC